ncbi:type IV secretion system protein VirB5 [Salipiger thiooxidans]|uniref:Type IV secretion system protein VirB5 n=1 Tax=Salipiger thiooxidans TaxID=282683 RepID=A0A1G7MML0_9RHOB|nr:type IV secretion system protein [Salipiger thiooxidans]SDF62953.1 type IV secretion system protein VirB5 [Salipiger thiooxidans]
MSRRTARTALHRFAFCVGTASAATFSLTEPGLAQGVPVIDGSNLAKNVEQLQQALQDAENQIEQIQQLKKQIELQMEQITSLEFIGDSLTGFNDIATLYNSAEDLRDRAAKITDLSGFADDLAMGDFDALLDNLLDGDVTMGEKHAAEQMRETLASAGLTSDRLSQLSSSENPQDKVIAQTAGTSATAIAAAQLSYEEAESSLERVNGLVGEIANQETLKESVDLNTRMAAETNFMLGQMWRLNAAAGLAQGQTGVNWAAEQAKERSFFDYSGTAD